MKIYNWSNEKNEILKKVRNISFIEIVEAIGKGSLLDDLEHPNKTKYPHQRLMVVEAKNYVYIVPYVIEDDGKIFLKTIYPERKAYKKYK